MMREIGVGRHLLPFTTQTMACSLCKQEGHNKRSCKQQATQVSPPRGNVADVKNKTVVETTMPKKRYSVPLAAAPSAAAAPLEPWKHILDLKGYIDQDSMVITANDIKSANKTWKGAAMQFEPRLLTYQTTQQQRPDIFKQLSLFILPTQNGTYLLTKQNIYQALVYDNAPSPVVVPRDKRSLVLTIGNSETSLLDNMRYAGILERPELLGEPITHGPLLNGRHRCNMDMTLGGVPITIRGVQYEVDSCYESENNILLLEGKSSTGPIDSFNIRQLYFPYREIQKYNQNKKRIICGFIHQLKNIIHVWTYQFTEEMEMLSIQEVGHYTYQLGE
jgi:hypothetical protein